MLTVKYTFLCALSAEGHEAKDSHKTHSLFAFDSHIVRTY